jgi:MFS family permease
MTVVGNWFHNKVSIATGIVVSGVAFGGLMVPLVTIAIDTYGWRLAMLIFSLVTLVVILPFSFIVRHKPEQSGLVPDGKKTSEMNHDKEQIVPINKKLKMGVGQILKNRPFWFIVLPITGYFLILNAVSTHIMPYLSSLGIERTTSSFVASALPIMSVLGRLGGGWFGDKIDKRYIVSASLALLGIGVALLYGIYFGGMLALIPFFITYSIGWGGIIPMQPALIREYFGREKLGTILGLAMGIKMLGMIAGPPMAGWIFDRYGSYQTAWFILIFIAFLGTIGTQVIPSLTKWQKTNGFYEANSL